MRIINTRGNYWLIGSPILLVIVLGILANTLLENQFSNWIHENKKQELLAQVRTASELFHAYEIHSDSLDKMDSLVKDLFDMTQSRFTIIAEDGKVLGDSDLRKEEVALIDNHADRPEVLKALRKGSASAIHYSTVLKSEMLYVAVLHQHDKFKVIIRASRSLNDIDKNLIIIRQIMLFVILFCITLILSLIWYINKLARKKYESKLTRIEDIESKRKYTVELLQELTNLLSTANTIDEVKDILSNVARRLFIGFGGALATIKASKNQSEVLISWGDKWPGETICHPSDCWSMRKGEAHLTQNNETGIKCNHFHEKPNAVSTLCIPMVAHGETVGIFHLTNRSPDVFTKENTNIAASVARQTGLTISNLKLQQSMRDQSIRDPLTGLFNRRYLDEVLSQEVSRARRHDTNFGVMMIDIDHFKRINDEYGHDAGDAALVKISDLFKNYLRNEDIACRYGGEEFTLIMPESNAASFQERAHELCKLVRETKFMYKNNTSINITVSIGLASFPDYSDEIDFVIKAADTALYQAKHAGRNQVVLANKDQFAKIKQEKGAG